MFDFQRVFLVRAPFPIELHKFNFDSESSKDSAVAFNFKQCDMLIKTISSSFLNKAMMTVETHHASVSWRIGTAASVAIWKKLMNALFFKT